MPREILTVQVGQCGNQIGMKFWDLALREHTTPKGILFDDSMSSFFKNESDSSESPRLRARAIVVDTEEGVINQITKSELGDLFDKRQFIKDVSGAGNNFAHGHFSYGPKYESLIIDKLRKSLEECDSPQCFMFTHSLGGGTGSGLGTYILKTLNDLYPELLKFSVSVFPSEDDDVITSPYNTMLAINQLIQHADCVMPIDNESLLQICNMVESETKDIGNKSRSSNINLSNTKNILELPKLIGGKFVKQIKESFNEEETQVNKKLSKVSMNKDKPFSQMNALIANLLSNTTCSMRFEGTLNVDINDITMNLVPFPRMHFITSALSPLYHVLDKKLEPRKVDQIFSDILDRNYQLISSPNFYNGIYLASALIARGNLSISDINHNITKQKHKLKMVHWNHEGFKIGLCDNPPVNMKYGLLSLSNHTSITDCFDRISTKFNKLYKVKAHMHHFTEYMEKSEFDNSIGNLHTLINDYNTVGIIKPKYNTYNSIDPIV